MPRTLLIEQVQKELLELFQEAFEKVGGNYLDKNTSLYESLANLSASEVSRSIVTGGSTIAAHVEHTRFYLEVLRAFLTGKRTGKVNWQEGWQLKQVNDEAWQALQANLKEEYLLTQALIQDDAFWQNDDALGGLISMLAHSTYHLGAIRQMLLVLKARS